MQFFVQHAAPLGIWNEWLISFQSLCKVSVNQTVFIVIICSYYANLSLFNLQYVDIHTQLRTGVNLEFTDHKTFISIFKNVKS